MRKDSSAKERPATSLNHLSIVAVPVSRTRYFWHNTRVQKAPLTITVGVEFRGKVEPLKMKFTHRGDELVLRFAGNQVGFGRILAGVATGRGKPPCA